MAFNRFGHIVTGLLAGGLIAQVPEQLAITIFGSLLPDIDHPKATLGRFNPLASIMKHRGWTHTVRGCILLSMPFALFDYYTVFGFSTAIYIFVGCLTHILGDRIQALIKGTHFKVKW
jgi:membrane-bound metal-dependent hydrolase YbcI (DUF457 family)